MRIRWIVRNKNISFHQIIVKVYFILGQLDFMLGKVMFIFILPRIINFERLKHYLMPELGVFNYLAP